MFVENFQCFKFVLEQKGKRGFICFFSSVILGFSSTIIPPVPMALLKAQQFSLSSKSSDSRKGWVADPALQQERGNQSVCAPHQLRGELQTKVFAPSPGHTGRTSGYSLLCCLCKSPKIPPELGSIASLLPSALKLTVESDCFSLQPVIWRLLQILDPFGARYFRF